MPPESANTLLNAASCDDLDFVQGWHMEADDASRERKYVSECCFMTTLTFHERYTQADDATRESVETLQFCANMRYKRAAL
jgi:hypothetical protein